MNKRVEKADQKFKKIERNFDELVGDYERVNAVLRTNDTPMQELYLFRAYLQQFEDVRDEIGQGISYSRTQLNDLRDDFQKGLYDEKQRTEYLNSEENALKEIEARLDYFSEHFKEQKEFVKSVQ